MNDNFLQVPDMDALAADLAQCPPRSGSCSTRSQVSSTRESPSLQGQQRQPSQSPQQSEKSGENVAPSPNARKFNHIREFI